MKLFPADWRGFLDDVATWGQLSIAARRTFLHGARPNLNMETADEDPATEELQEAGFLSSTDNPGYLSVSPEYAKFHQLTKALERMEIFDAPGFDVLREYLSEHFSQAERSSLHESLAFHPDDFGRIASLVTSADWLTDFLSRDRTSRADLGITSSQKPRTLACARQMLKFFMEQRSQVPVRDLEEYFPSMNRIEVAASLKLGVQCAVFFLSLRKTDFEPLVGIWPSIARRLHRVQIALAPEAVAPEKSFRHPFIIEDMTTILLSARAEPIPVRRLDEKPFARFEEEQAQALLSLPGWLEEFSGATPRIRVESALSALRVSGLLSTNPAEENLRYSPADGAMEWAALGLRDRLEGFIHRASHEGRRKGREKGRRQSALLSLLVGSWATWAEAAADIIPPLAQAFSSVPRTSFIRFKDFARYQTAIANPLIPLRERGGGSPLWAGLASLPTDELLEDLWQSFLHAYLCFGLLAVGGAEAGIAGGQPAFRLTAVGRHLLESAAAAEEEEPEAAPEPCVVVQPTFEVAFLSPQPSAEAEIARFSERLGREVGVLFRITKASIQRAAAAGLDAERVMAALSRWGKNPVPPNVEYEIRGWLGSAGAAS